MRTSDTPATPSTQETQDTRETQDTPVEHRGRRRLVTVVLTLVCVVVIDVLLSLALEPYGSHSELVWSDYRATSTIDTLLSGSSYTAYGLDPRVIDVELDAHSFNLATPGQSVHNMLTALRSASKEHQLKRVVLCVGYESMAAVPSINSSIIFTQTKSMGESPADVLVNVRDLLFDEYYFGNLLSISCAFPWGYDHVDYTQEAIGTNIRNRMEGDLRKAGEWYAQEAGEDWSYEAQGFGGVDRSITTQNFKDQVFIDHPDTEFYEGNVNSYRSICELCAQEGVPLYVIGAPHTPSAVNDYGEAYRTDMARLKDIAEEYDAVFWDFNMIQRSVFDPDHTYFCDQSHLSNVGAGEFSKVVADLIGRFEAGEDVSGLFYAYDEAGWQAYHDSIDYVDSVDCATQKVEGGTLVTASVVAGKDVPVAYRFDVFDEASQEWKTMRDYDADPTYLVPGDSSGSPITYRVYAQATNGNQDEPRWLEDTIS